MEKNEMLSKIEEMINDSDSSLFIKKIRDNYFITLTHNTIKVNIRGEERNKKVEIAFKVVVPKNRDDFDPSNKKYVLRVGYDTWSTYMQEELTEFFAMLDERYESLIVDSKEKKINRVENKINNWNISV